MTLPNERTRAVIYARNFLRDLLFRDVTPRVPKAIRERARSILKHFPGDHDLYEAAEKAPKIFDKPKDGL